MIHCWLKEYLNFRGCQQTGRWFDLPRGPRLLLFSLPPPSLCCSVSGNRSSLWREESWCLCAALALLPPSAKGLPCLREDPRWLSNSQLPVLGVVPGVNAWLGCSLSLQQLQKAFFPQNLPTPARWSCDGLLASQKLRINSTLAECTCPANSPQQVG